MRTHTVVAAPAGGAVGRISHLLQGLGPQVAQLPQAAVMENPGADSAGVEVVGCPDFAHVAHLVARRLRSGLRDTKTVTCDGWAEQQGDLGGVLIWRLAAASRT